MAESVRDYLINFLFKTDVAGAKKAQGQLERLKHGLEDLGKKAFIFNEIFDSVNRITEPFRKFGELVAATAEEADALQDLSERTDIATESLEEYAFMANLSGTSQEAMVTGMRILEKQMGEAANGSKSAQEAFGKLGISLHGANGKMKTTEELLPEVSGALEKIPDHARKTAAAMELFGRSGQELLPLLSRGAEEINNMRLELRALGGETSGEFLESSEQYADNVHRMAAAWKGIKQAISGPIIRMLNSINNALIMWWKANGQLVRSRLSEWFFQLRTSLEALWDTFVKIAKPVLLLAAALNVPLLVMIAMKLMIALLIDDFANWMAGNDSLIGRAIANWDKWIDKIAETHPVLAALLDAFGRTVKNMSVLVESIFRLFDTLIDSFLEGGWDGFMKELGTTFRTAIDGWKEVFSGFFSWVMDKIRSIPGWNLVFGDSDMPSDEKKAEMAARRRAFERSVPGAQSTAAGVAGQTTNNGGSVNAQASIVVNVPEGQDPRRTAEEISRMWDEKFDSEIRQGFNQLVPEAY